MDRRSLSGFGIGTAAATVVDARDLPDLLDLVVSPEQLVRGWQVDDLVFGENGLDVGLELLPLVVAPEIIDDQETAGQQIIPEPFDFRVAQVHRADFDRVNEREMAQV